MIDLSAIKWYADKATRSYIEEHSDILQNPDSMTTEQLAIAITYCNDIDNPYMEELTKKTGCFEKFHAAEDAETRMNILRKALKAFNVVLI